MTERFEETPKPVEFGQLNINGEAHEINTENTSLYRHLGRFALYDHVFVKLKEQRVAYIWSTMNGYDDISTAAVYNGCEMHLNLREANESDVKNYERFALKDLNELDHFPEEWLNGEK